MTKNFQSNSTALDHEIKTDNAKYCTEIKLTEKEIQYLIDCAKEARTKAYCPYSKFAVGAALRTTDGKIFTGCNVENASFPTSICAERTAIAKAVSEGYRDFVACAVVAQNDNSFVYPCGACRQVLSEFTNLDIDMHIFLANPEKSHLIFCTSLKKILPFIFKLKK